MSRKKITVAAVVIASLLVLAGVAALLVVRRVGPDVSCSSAGRDAQPQVQRAVEELPGVSNPSWHDGCRDGAVAALRFDYAGTRQQFAAGLAAAGCTAPAEPGGAWHCAAGATRYSLTLHEAGGPGRHSGLAVVTATS